MALCDSPAVARHAVDELGLHSTLAEVLPRVSAAAWLCVRMLVCILARWAPDHHI